MTEASSMMCDNTRHPEQYYVRSAAVDRLINVSPKQTWEPANMEKDRLLSQGKDCLYFELACLKAAMAIVSCGKGGQS